MTEPKKKITDWKQYEARAVFKYDRTNPWYGHSLCDECHSAVAECSIIIKKHKDGSKPTACCDSIECVEGVLSRKSVNLGARTIHLLKPEEKLSNTFKRVEISLQKGFGLVATSDIPAWSTVMVCSPVIVADRIAQSSVLEVDSAPSCLKELYPRDEFTDTTTMLAEKVKSNAFTVSAEASAVYHTLSFVNHDCNPNCVVYFEASTFVATLVALRKVLKDEELTIHYGKAAVRLNCECVPKDVSEWTCECGKVMPTSESAITCQVCDEMILCSQECEEKHQNNELCKLMHVPEQDKTR